MGAIVNKQELSEILGKSERTLTTWQKNGMPIAVDGVRGSSNQYDTAKVIEWLISREVGKLTVSGDGTVHDYDSERARLTFHQANKTALEESVLKGTLIPAERVESFQCDMVSAFRAKVLAIPTKAAHAILGLDDLSEAQDVLKSFLYEALNELADYEPDQYGIDDAAANSGNGSTPTRADHE